MILPNFFITFCVYECIYLFIRTFMGVLVALFLDTCIDLFIHLFVHLFTHLFVHLFVDFFINVCVYVFMRLCICVCVSAFVEMWKRENVEIKNKGATYQSTNAPFYLTVPPPNRRNLVALEIHIWNREGGVGLFAVFLTHGNGDIGRVT